MSTAKMQSTICQHKNIHLNISDYAADYGYKRPSKTQRLRDATRSGTAPSKRQPLLTDLSTFDDLNTFPAPLVLPDDDLDMEPADDPQSMKEYWTDTDRNSVTPQRHTIYIVRSPQIDAEMAPMKTWATTVPGKANKLPIDTDLGPLKADDVKDYIGAFYHGMQVKLLPQTFYWQAWEHEHARQTAKSSQPHRKRKPKYDGTPLTESDQEQLLGLRTPRDIVGVRCRRAPDGVARMQVHLNDVIDALIENLPTDAYAVIMLLDMDMYEGDDDIFTAGRAYGGSRVAVATSFRDHPSCAPDSGGHRWPASHCEAFIHKMSYGEPSAKQKVKAMASNTKDKSLDVSSSPMRLAIDSSSAGFDKSTMLTKTDLYVEWLSCVVQTMTHELGHCIGLGHCVYYACAMQGCASTAEALRQPPYLCPICLEKLAWAIGENIIPKWDVDDANRHARKATYVYDRYEALRRVCERWSGMSPAAGMFTGYKAWLEAMMGTKPVPEE